MIDDAEMHTSHLGQAVANVMSDHFDGFYRFKNEAENGDAVSQHKVGLMYKQHAMDVPEDPKNDQHAVRFLEMSALQGNPDGLYALGKCVSMCV